MNLSLRQYLTPLSITYLQIVEPTHKMSSETIRVKIEPHTKYFRVKCALSKSRVTYPKQRVRLCLVSGLKNRIASGISCAVCLVTFESCTPKMEYGGNQAEQTFSVNGASLYARESSNAFRCRETGVKVKCVSNASEY